jgi:hypothetical protein
VGWVAGQVGVAIINSDEAGSVEKGHFRKT